MLEHAQGTLKEGGMSPNIAPRVSEVTWKK